MEGELIAVDNLKEFGEKRGFKKLTWEKLNHLSYYYALSKEEIQFLNKYGFKLTFFNCACVSKLKAIFLYPADLKRIERGFK
jgi:hypothetical protein